MGIRCRYDGGSKPIPLPDSLTEQYVLVPVCPEVLGGLPTPRDPSERIGERICTCSGKDVTDAYRRGAEETLRIALLSGCTCALLKERSPSCGLGMVYDGTFTGTLCSGNGVTAELLQRNGIRVLGESRVGEFSDSSNSCWQSPTECV